MSTPEQNKSLNLQHKLYRQILGYLIAHPDSKDTLEGILKWWLPIHPIEWGAEQVQEALDSFLAKGWLIKRVLPSGQKLFSLNKMERKEIEGFLKIPEDKGELRDV